MIRAGSLAEIRPDNGLWIFLDAGLGAGRTTGLAIGDGAPFDASFATAARRVQQAILSAGRPVNIVVEAPLSLTLRAGEPVPRAFEINRDFEPRDRRWNKQPAPVVLWAAVMQVRGWVDATPPAADVRLFEGFASFRRSGTRGSHRADVEALRRIVRTPKTGRLYGPEAIAARADDTVCSVLEIAGMAIAPPPVILVPPDA